MFLNKHWQQTWGATLKNIVLCVFAKKFQIQPSNWHFDCLK